MQIPDQSRALAPDQATPPVAARPYDLRHAAVSLWLNAGVPPTTIANRAVHSVDGLLRVYPNCIDGDEEVANQRIAAALALSVQRTQYGSGNTLCLNSATRSEDTAGKIVSTRLLRPSK